MRLDKYLTEVASSTRSAVKQWISQKAITVNGNLVTKGNYQVDEETDVVAYQNRVMRYQKFFYIMLHKPAGYLCATTDKIKPVIFDLLKEYQNRGLFSIGRLDMDTEGLLLITNDGDLSHKLLHPKYHIAKTYAVTFWGIWNQEYQAILENGTIVLDGEHVLPAKCQFLSHQTALLTIEEGKYHQVKRMFHAVGLEVSYLKRMTFGPLTLPEDLPKGSYRFLTKEEIAMLKALV